MQTTQKQKRSPWLIILIIIVVLTAISMLFAGIIGMFVETPQFGNVARIHIHGPLTVDPAGGFQSGGASSQKIIPLIKEAEEDASIQAILFDINSPGGSAVASDEIGRAIKNISKPTVALIREVGASGGYWVASAADHIIVNRMTITGSIGVIGAYLEFDEFLARYNVTYRRMVAGKYKDMGSPYKDLTPEEAALFQQLLDDIRVEFVQEVSTNRNLDYADVDRLATGQVYLGKHAQELGLVDELGGESEAIEYLQTQLNATVDFIEFEPESSLWDMLAGVLSGQSYSVGTGIGDALFTQQEKGLPELR